MTEQTLDRQRIQPAQLPTGSPLPTGLYDDHGRVLAPAGRVLTEDDRTRLARRPIFADPAAMGITPTGAAGGTPDPNAPPPRVAGTERLIEQACDGVIHKSSDAFIVDERRRTVRYPCELAVQLDLYEQVGDTNRQRSMRVRTTDLSVGGFGFGHAQYLVPGTAFAATFTTLAGEPTFTGVIRSCIKPSGEPHHTSCAFREAA